MSDSAFTTVNVRPSRVLTLEADEISSQTQRPKLVTLGLDEEYSSRSQALWAILSGGGGNPTSATLSVQTKQTRNCSCHFTVLFSPRCQKCLFDHGWGSSPTSSQEPASAWPTHHRKGWGHWCWGWPGVRICHQKTPEEKRSSWMFWTLSLPFPSLDVEGQRKKKSSGPFPPSGMTGSHVVQENLSKDSLVRGLD